MGVMFLVEGNQVYFDEAHKTVEYFSKLGHKCPPFTNPSEYVLTLINTDFEGHADVPALVEAYQNSCGRMDGPKRSMTGDVGGINKEMVAKRRPSLLRQFH